MTTPDSWVRYAARALERERWRMRGVWSTETNVTTEEAEQARLVLMGASSKKVKVNGVVWTWEGMA